jgi:hypothetical protein
MYIHSKNFFSNEYEISSFKLLKSIYKTLCTDINNDNYKFFCVICMVININNNSYDNITSECEKIIKSLQYTVHNFKIELYNGTTIQCIKEIIKQIPYINLQLNDINDNNDYFKFYNLNFSSNLFNIIIDYLYDNKSFSYNLDMDNVFELLIISEQLLLPSIIIKQIIDYLHTNNIELSSYLSHVDNININTLTEISTILEALKKIYQRDNYMLFKINSIYKNIFDTVYNTIMDNYSIFLNTIFYFDNHMQLFSNKLHMKAIIISNQYHKFNDTCIKPKKILKFLKNKEKLSINDKIINRYDWNIIFQNNIEQRSRAKINLINANIKKINKIYNKFSWQYPEVYYFNNDNYKIYINNYADNITVIKNYYPYLYYIVYKKIYITWRYINNHLIKVHTDSILPNTNIVISHDNIITQHINTVYNRKVKNPYESILYLKESITENYTGNDIWSVKHYSYNFNL